jgi:F-type H+-transporting ATPase subunit delta
MQNQRVAQRYALSLFELANEQGVIMAVAQDMQDLELTARGSRELRVVFKNPIIKSSDKLAILKSLFASSFHSLTMSFFDLVISKKREVFVLEMAEEFIKLRREQLGIITATVTTASVLDDSLRAKISEIVVSHTGKQVELTEIVDAKVIGGYKLKIEDREIDDTVASKLAELKLKLIDQTYIAQI